jgi:IS30 family transposase
MKKGHIKKEERLEISILLKRGYSYRTIAKELERSHTSISREIRRNSEKGEYSPHRASQKARNKRKCSKYQGMKVQSDPELRRYVQEKLKLLWTPEDISGRIKESEDHLTNISAKGIYKWLYSAYGQAYCKYLPKKRYRPRRKKGKSTKREMIPNRVGIEYRILAANNREEYGHFEGDTVVSGKKHKTSASLLVMVDRKSRYVKLKKLSNLKPSECRKAMETLLSSLHKKTLTLDNGIENKDHETLSKNLDIDVYFCDPYASWQKGGVENVNGVVRRFIPKGANINDYSDAEIQMIENYLNSKPKKCLNYKTPYEVMTENNLFLNKKDPSGAFEG